MQYARSRMFPCMAGGAAFKEPAGEGVYLILLCPEDTERLLQAVTAVEENEKESYQREFSIREFADSKALEK